MRFAKQKFTIILGFFLLPLIFIFAILQRSEVSNFVLGVALKVVRLQTGLKIEAASWEVNPLSFSASLADIKVQFPTFSVSSPEIRLQFSPLSLLLGEISLRNLRIERAMVEGSLPPELLKGSADKKEFNFNDLDLPTVVGKKVADISAFLSGHHLNFDELTLVDLQVQLKEIKLGRGNILLENLDAGQLRLDWELENFAMIGESQSVRELRGSIALIRESRADFYLAVRTLSVKLDASEKADVEVFGRVPGELQVRLATNLEPLNAWLGASKVTKDYHFAQGLHGQLQSDLRFEIPRKGTRRLQGELKVSGLQLEEYYPNNVEVEFNTDFKDWKVSKLEVELPRNKGDDPKWKRRIYSRNIEIADQKIRGTLNLDEAPMCAILRAAGIDECYLTFAASSTINLVGDLDPFELRLSPEFDISNGKVFSEPYPHVTGDPTLLKFKKLKLSADLLVRPKDMLIKKAEVAWADDAKFTGSGTIKYVPTLVELTVDSEKLNLEKTIENFLDLNIQGHLATQANIYYNYQIPREEGRTRVNARVNIEGFGIESQVFGSVTGPVNYQKNALQIGALKVRNGGGSSTVEGQLVQRDFKGVKSAYLDVSARLDRLEMDMKSQSGTEIFHGFVSGSAQLKGFTDPDKDQGLSGPIDFSADTVKSFGIPFQTATARAFYSKKILFIQSIRGRKDVGTLDLSGELRPTGGTELRFKTDDFRIDNIGYFPKLEERFERGFMRVEGYWRPASGWQIDGQLSQLKMGDRNLPNGTMKLGGDGKTFLMALDLGDQIEGSYRADSTSSHLRPIAMKFRMRNQGIYAGLAYLREWVTPYPVDTKGSVEIEWEPTRGLFRTQDLDIRGPDGVENKVKSLVHAPGIQELSWEGSKLVKDSLRWTGPSELSAERAASGKVGFRAALPLSFVGLFMPNMTQMLAGTLQIQGEFPLPIALDPLTARLKIDNGTVFLRSIGQNLTNLNGEMDLRGQRLIVNRAAATLGSGNVNITGAYKVDFFQPAVSLNIKMNRAKIVVMDEVPLDVTGDVTLNGDSYPFLMSGRVQVVGGSYAKEFGTEITAPPATDAQALLRYALEVDIQPQFYVRNSLVNAPVSGRVTLTGTDLRALVKGNIEVGRGSIYAKDHEFKIIQGRVTFFDKVDAAPVVILQASTLVKQPNQNYKVDLSARGPTNNLNIEFTSDPSLPTRDIVNLLAFGIVRSGTETTAVTQTNPSASYTDTVRAEALQALFGKSIGPSLFKSTGFQVKVQAAPDLSQNETVTKVTVGRKLSERMSATFGRSIDAGKNEKNLQVDYRLLKNVNISGVYESPNPQESSKGVDLRFRFDIK